MTKSTRTSEPVLSRLADGLRRCQEESGDPDTWPEKALQLLWQARVPDWFVPSSLGGDPRSNQESLEIFLELGSACLTTTFVLTQFAGAIRRITSMADLDFARRILDEIRDGAFVTLGISHLTTSRQHQGTPALRAEIVPGGFELTGSSPWVTGAQQARWIVTGAILPDGQPLLLLVPTDLKGLTVSPPVRLVALTGSCTGAIHFDRAVVDQGWVVLGPGLASQSAASVAATGGLQTSALALALTRTAFDFIQRESVRRPDLVSIHEHLRREWDHLVEGLRICEARAGEPRSDSATTGTPSVSADWLLPSTTNAPIRDGHDLRARANSLVLRATHAALTAAKGAGFVEGHPAGRWCREALFFLVWSCPPGVMQTQLCEFAGITH